MAPVGCDGGCCEQPQIQDRPVSKLHVRAVRSRQCELYKITQLLPPENDDFQYKIKSAAEPREGGQGASLTTPDDAGTLIQGHDYDV